MHYHTPVFHAEPQLATSSHRSLANFYGVNFKSVEKWRARPSLINEPMGRRGQSKLARFSGVRALVKCVVLTRVAVAGRAHEVVRRHPRMYTHAAAGFAQGALQALAIFAVPTSLAIAVVRLHADAPV